MVSTALYPWQHQAWEQLQQQRGRWPHALLLHGPSGIGKTDFAEWLAQSLLCESVQADGQACGQCVSCGWFGQYAHPDFRRVRPEALDEETGSADGAESGADAGADVAAAPAAAKSPAARESKADTKANGKPESKSAGKSRTATKAPSKEIVINQIRSLADFMTLSTHRRGLRVILIYPAEAMNGAAANALLKSLEEPGPGTVFILVSQRIDVLLPTIISRCHQFSMGQPSREAALAWLTQQQVATPLQFLAEQGGSPLAALAASQSDHAGEQQEFFRFLHKPDVAGALKVADKCQKTAMPLVISWLQRWLYDVFSTKLTGCIRYYPRYQRELAVVANAVPLAGLLTLLASCNQRAAVSTHPLSARLLIEEMLLEYCDMVGRQSTF